MKIKLADIVFSFCKSAYQTLSIVSADYVVSDNEKSDFVIEITESDIDEEIGKVNFKAVRGAFHFSAAHRKIADLLHFKNAFVLHSVAFDVNGVGVAFAAHSGTGKTTHTMLWQQLLGDKMTIVNGDKPFVRFFDNLENAPEGTEIGVPYAYGTPWNGKEHLGCNMRTPLKHICFIERSETNYVEKISANDAIDRIFNQVYMPQNPEAMMNTMQLINRLINSCELWIIHCNMDISAAQTAYNEIFK